METIKTKIDNLLGVGTPKVTKANHKLVLESVNVTIPDNVIYVGTGKDFATIQGAIDSVTSNAVIIIDSDTYIEDVQIYGKTNLTIMNIVKSIWNGTTVINGAIVNGKIDISDSTFINIQNIGIIAVTNAISIFGDEGNVSNCSFKNITIKNNIGYHGIIFESNTGEVKDSLIENVSVYGGTHGFISKSINATFINCYAESATVFGFGLVSDNASGAIAFSVCKNNTLINCNAKSCAYGFSVYCVDSFSEDLTNLVETVNNIKIIGCSAFSCGISLNLGQGSEFTYPKLETGKSHAKVERILISDFISQESVSFAIQLFCVNGASFSNTVLKTGVWGFYATDTTNYENISFSSNQIHAIDTPFNPLVLGDNVLVSKAVTDALDARITALEP